MEKFIDSVKDVFHALMKINILRRFNYDNVKHRARFIIDELDDDLRKIISNTIVRRVVIF